MWKYLRLRGASAAWVPKKCPSFDDSIQNFLFILVNFDYDNAKFHNHFVANEASKTFRPVSVSGVGGH